MKKDENICSRKYSPLNMGTLAGFPSPFGELALKCQGDGSLDTFPAMRYGLLEVRKMPRTAREKSETGIYRGIILGKLKEEGLSIRQIERLTGLNRGVVLKA